MDTQTRFCALVTLTSTRWPWYTNLPSVLKIYMRTRNELSRSELSRGQALRTDRQIHRRTRLQTLPRAAFAGVENDWTRVVVRGSSHFMSVSKRSQLTRNHGSTRRSANERSLTTVITEVLKTNYDWHLKRMTSWRQLQLNMLEVIN